jgi:uncharacterized protein
MPIELQEPKTAMQCPVCRVSLVMTDRQNIEIDYCPKCRGVWLDRGELDKIIERSAGQFSATEPRQDQDKGSQDDGYREDRHGSHGRKSRSHDGGHGGGYGSGHGSRGHSGRGYRKKSWLHELFD